MPVLGCFQGRAMARGICTTRLYHSGVLKSMTLQGFFADQHLRKVLVSSTPFGARAKPIHVPGSLARRAASQGATARRARATMPNRRSEAALRLTGRSRSARAPAIFVKDFSKKNQARLKACSPRLRHHVTRSTASLGDGHGQGLRRPPRCRDAADGFRRRAGHGRVIGFAVVTSSAAGTVRGRFAGARPTPSRRH